MKIPKAIFETGDFKKQLEKKGLISQYKKAKTYILSNDLKSVSFKERQPKGKGIYYFRINKQFRVMGMFDINNNFIVGVLDNHQ